MKGNTLKTVGIYAAIVALFVILAYGFVPEVLGGKIVNQNDISGWRGMAQESIEWNAAHPDDKALWSDSMFGGMPTVTMLDDFQGDWTKPLYKIALWGTRPASYLFIALLGAFLMMLAMGVNRFLAVAGAIAVAFCSYNFQIIQVGHNTKMQAIAFAPWVIAAMLFTYRSALGEREGKDSSGRKWLPLTMLGSVLFALALSFQIKANHVQITYYLAIIILVYGIATLIWVLTKAHRDKLSRFAVASALLVVTGLVGIGTNANKLIPTAAYAPYTMRGGSELTTEGANADGLALDYATRWSYGVNELPNLMIPNYNGGSSSGSLDDGSAMWELFRKAGQNPRQVCSNLPLYWGPQPFTAGPVYLGAISIFLFILGLFVLRGREKWWLLVCCILAVLLSLGRHFIWFTELWFKYAPMYNKFRTVSMALVALQFCVPLLGIYALDRIMKEEIPHRKVVRSVWISLAITGGFCLIVALIPSIAGDFISSSDEGFQDVIADALRKDRRRLFQIDAWRSFLFILAAAAVIIWSYMKPDPFVASARIRIAAGIIGVLILADMWSAGKRYLNSDHFITSRNFSSQFTQRPVDKEILCDESLSYRVLDLSENPFNSSVTSYHHKSIGGYSPTKMQRYQDLIEHYILSEIRSFYAAVGEATTLGGIQNAVPEMPVVSMLNGRYIIIGAEYPPIVNPYAFGEAWFVGGTVEAATPDDEIAALGTLDLRNTAVVSSADKATIPAESAVGENRMIRMTSYSPNELRYEYESDSASTVVFSEIFHPSWTATLNGEPLNLFRADWVLRAACVPAGKGEIVMKYEPRDYVQGRALSRICSAILLLLLVAAAAVIGLEKRKKQNKYIML